VVGTLAPYGGYGRRIGEERARVEAEYRRVLRARSSSRRESGTAGGAKCRLKNERIAELQKRVVELERRLADAEEH
jgi:hypothetical protein